MLITPSGEHIIFDVTEFLPGRPIPGEYLEEAELGGVFFFMPSSWTEEEGWGSWIGSARNYPLLYSTGFPTAEQALAAAIEWEATKEEREARNAGFHKMWSA